MSHKSCPLLLFIQLHSPALPAVSHWQSLPYKSSSSTPSPCQIVLCRFYMRDFPAFFCLISRFDPACPGLVSALFSPGLSTCLLRLRTILLVQIKTSIDFTIVLRLDSCQIRDTTQMAETQLEAMLTKISSYSKRTRKSAIVPIGEETERAGSIGV